MRPRMENLNLNLDEELMNLYQAGNFAALKFYKGIRDEFLNT